MASVPRRHHYVTEAYLSGFLEPGTKQLCCYGRNHAMPFPAAPSKLANIRDFHSLRRPDGTLDTSLETRIEKEVEGPGIPVLRLLAKGNINISSSQRNALAKLIALQSLRVPYEREFMDRQNREIFLGYINEMDEISRRLGIRVNELETAVSLTSRRMRSEEYSRISRAEIETELRAIDQDPQRFSRENFIWLANDVARIFARMEWTLCIAPGASRFITSDRPVISADKDGRPFMAGFARAECEITFPLSHSALLKMRHPRKFLDKVRRRPNASKQRSKSAAEIAIKQLESAAVTELNHLQSDQAHLWVFSGLHEVWISERMQNHAIGSKVVRVVSDRTFLSQDQPRNNGFTRERRFSIDIE